MDFAPVCSECGRGVYGKVSGVIFACLECGKQVSPHDFTAGLEDGEQVVTEGDCLWISTIA